MSFAESVADAVFEDPQCPLVRHGRGRRKI